MKPEPGKYIIQDENGDGWCILATIIVLQEADCRSGAVDQVIAVAQKLHWAAEDLIRLRLALTEAVQALPLQSPPAALLIVRVFLRLATGRYVTTKPATETLHENTPPSWGFFIVQKDGGNEAQTITPAGEQSDLIELFLYQE